MASIPHSSLALGGASASASDYLRSSSNGVSGIPLRTLGRQMFTTTRRRDLSVSARLKKGKKFDHPWPANPDPNVKGGIFSYLSTFKPLGDQQKPVTLDFERPLVELEKKILDVRKMANETGLDFTAQIITLENKYRQALKDLYTHLTPIQRVNIARHPNRPTYLDHIYNITDTFMELHGDRAGYDDPAIVTGIGTIDGKPYVFIGHQKGRNTKENIMRNFGMPTPHGYRKALRIMRYADHHNFPIVTFVDTPGAYADLKSEELGQGEAIAQNLRTMFALKVPILTIVIGEGGSGGALAIACANKMLMLENSVFYVASPEACAAILWKTATAAPEAAEKLRITSKELLKLNIADGIIPEPLGGAHADPTWTSQQIKKAIKENMDEFEKMSGEELLKHRAAKYRKIGVFVEGEEVDPVAKVNMKKREVSDSRELEGEVEKLKEQILKAKETSSEEEPPSSEVLNEMIEKLKSEIDDEYTEAAKALGLEERLTAMREEFSKASEEEHLMHPAMIEKIEKLKEEFDTRLVDAPNYESLKSKLNTLRDFSRAKAASEAASLRKEINRQVQEVVVRPEIQEKVEALQAEVESSGALSFEELSDELKEKVIKTKKEVEEEMEGVLKSMGLELEANPDVTEVVEQSLVPQEDLEEKLEKLNQEISEKIEEVVKSPEIKSMVELMKVEAAKASQTPGDTEASQKIEALEQQIKQKISEALSLSGLQEKHEALDKEMAAARKLAVEESLKEAEQEDNDNDNDNDEEDGPESGKQEIVNPGYA